MLVSLILSFSSCHSIQTMEHEYFDCPEYVASTQAEVDRAVEFECEVSKMLSETI